MADVTDKKRLRQIQQQDLTESRLNDDFVYWLKNSGMNWLLGILVIMCGYSLLNFYWQKKDAARDNAWAELSAASASNIAESYASVATDHEGVDSVALLAWLSAGDSHLQDLQVGLMAPAVATAPDGTPNPPIALTAETRASTQAAADGFYTKVLEKIGARKSELAMKPIAIAALFGKAAVAESRGAIDAAKSALSEAESLAGDAFPIFASEAKRRNESLATLASLADLPTRASLPAKAETAPVAPSVVDELSRSMTAPPPAPAPAPGATPAFPPPSAPAPTDPAGTLDARPRQPATPPAAPPKANPG